MKISVNKKRNSVRFEDLSAGAVFENSGYYYIKVVEPFKIDGDMFNAIDLDDGDVAYFVDNDEVLSVNATLTIDE